MLAIWRRPGACRRSRAMSIHPAPDDFQCVSLANLARCMSHELAHSGGSRRRRNSVYCSSALLRRHVAVGFNLRNKVDLP